MVDYHTKDKQISIQFPLFQTQKCINSDGKLCIFGRYGQIFFSITIDQIESIMIGAEELSELTKRDIIDNVESAYYVEHDTIEHLLEILDKIAQYKKNKK